MPPSTAPRVTLARILRARGRRGEVAAEILTDFPERLTKLREAYLWDGTRELGRVGVRSCWLARSRGGQAIFHFEGVDSIAEAEKLVGLTVQVPLADRMPLPAGRYYVTDLIGCEVWERGTSGAYPARPERSRGEPAECISPGSSRLGIVRDVQFTGQDTPGTPLLVVDTPQGELLIPLAEEICTRIDTSARRIEVLLPGGLRELSHS